MGPIGVEHRSNNKIFKGLSGILGGAECRLNGADLTFYKAIRPWEVGEEVMWSM